MDDPSTIDDLMFILVVPSAGVNIEDAVVRDLILIFVLLKAGVKIDDVAVLFLESESTRTAE